MKEGDMVDSDRAFWLAVYRAVCAIAKAIKRWKLGGKENDEND